ncbi:MAG: hypothetical protein Q8S11_06345 [Daejeonella sp.]|uniref:hypothetical protein n=1 Tax=Daejeonella sp. TaxID=2805397 RepID=UPI0027376DCF|nr:hypothetical protein [Daejeonella sp.]MDP3467935.1 hypothetical protein [Daejeonella sp.]
MKNIKGVNIRISKLQLILLVASFLFLTIDGKAQSINGWLGTPVTFDTSADILTNKTSSNYLTLQYSLNSNSQSGWTVIIQANSNFSNGTAIIDASFVSLSYASSSGGPAGTTGTGYQSLSTNTAKSMINSSGNITGANRNFQQLFDMRVSGGNHLNVGSGTYSTTLTVTILDRNGAVMATNNNIPVSFVVNYSSTCQGATLNTYSSTQGTFTTYAEQMAGKTVTDALSVQYSPNGATCDEWSLHVRAAGNFTNGSQSVAPQFFSLRFNRVSTGTPTATQIGVSNTPVVLNNTDVVLIDGSNAPFGAYVFTEHKFDMLIQGGSHLMVPNGTYTATLIFSLYNSNNVLVSTSTVAVSFQVNSVSNSFTLELQNSANEINLVFNTLESYVNGVSVNKPRGMRVVGYQPYQVLIKTSGINLVGSESNTIPVAAVNVQTTKYTSSSGGISTFSRALSTADQVIVTNPMVDYTQQVVEYDLRYYTAANDSRLSGKTGTFNTTVLFVIIPQ